MQSALPDLDRLFQHWPIPELLIRKKLEGEGASMELSLRFRVF